MQVVGVVGVVGYLSFRNGQTAVTDLASQLQSELTDRILRELQATVERPYIINQLNTNSLLQGDIDVSTGKGEHLLWQQAAIFPTTNLVYCSTEAHGDFLGVGRSGNHQDDRLQIQVANRTTDRYFHYYDIDRSGRRSSLISQGDKPYDPRIRPWYEAAKSKRSSVWSEIYLDFDTQLPKITASTPVYTGEENQLLGVCATDIILSKELSSFLQNLEISKSGIAFIIDTSGLLLASSTSEPIAIEQGEVTELLLAHESDNRLIRKTARYLGQTYPNLENLQSSQLKLLIDNELQYLQFVRFDDQPGLEWIIVLIVPEDDFMEQIIRNTQITFLLCFIALIIT
ncbi:MAG: cache domain-containing protein, partial [Cyanobacteria bacterium J06559_3]